MNADAATPAAPVVPPPQPPAPVPQPGAVPLPQSHSAPPEPNALMLWAQKTWAGLKEGKVGSPKVLLIALLVLAAGGGVWAWLHFSKVNDSARWRDSDLAVNFFEQPKKDEGPAAVLDARMKRLQAVATNYPDTPAARIAKLNELRLRRDDAMRRLSAGKLADRTAGADDLDKVRDELAAAADWFATDRTMKTRAFEAAAECELALIGVPKKGVVNLDFQGKENSRGQVGKYADLLRKAADAIGKETDPGKAFTEKADKLTGPGGDELYTTLVAVHKSFNHSDAFAPPPGGTVPGFGQIDPTDDGSGPRVPPSVPPNPK